MKCRWKFIPPAATAAGNGHKSSVGSCLHRYFVIFYFLSPEFDGNKQGGDEKWFISSTREKKKTRERESDLRHVTSLVWAPHRREKEVGARVHLDHQGNRHRPGLGFFFCFVFLQIFPFTHTQHIKVFPSRRTKNYFENKKKKTLKLKFFFHPSIFEDLNSFVLVEGKSQRTSFPNPFNVNR